MVRSLTSWLWLVDFETTGRALDATDEKTGDVGACLRGHFAQVDVLRRSPLDMASVQASNAAEGWEPSSIASGAIDATRWEAATFDCIMLHDAIVRSGQTQGTLVATLKLTHRLLRRGGWLQVASPNPTLRPGSRGSGVSRRKLTGSLRHAGFSDVRGYHVESALDRLLHLVPADRSAVGAYESSGAMRGSTRWTRRLAAALRVEWALYPAYMLLARA